MRGNPTPPCPTGIRCTSIPAYAGEPSAPTATSESQSVYPRVCGGTAWCDSDEAVLEDLSPRMRGNLRAIEEYRKRMGSIPAYAGEPLRRSIAAILRPVYPRVCGGTPAAQYSGNTAPRLSPRMRGNRLRGRHLPGGAASIPAYAGELW